MELRGEREVIERFQPEDILLIASAESVDAGDL